MTTLIDQRSTAGTMPTLRDGRRPRTHRRIGGLCCFVAPATLMGSDLAYRGTNDPAQLVSDAVHHRAAITAAMVLLLVSSAALIPAVFTVMHLARDRGRRLATAGVALSILGALGHAAYAGFTTVQLGTAGGDHQQMVELLRRVDHSATVAPIAVCILAFALGFVCVVVAAWRAGLVPVAAPVLAGAAFLVELANAHSVAAGAIKEGLAVVALGWIGVAVLRTGDAAWAAPSS